MGRLFQVASNAWNVPWFAHSSQCSVSMHRPVTVRAGWENVVVWPKRCSISSWSTAPRGEMFPLRWGHLLSAPIWALFKPSQVFFFFFSPPSWLPFFQKCFQPFPLYVLMLELPFSASALKWHRGRCRFFSQKSFCAWCVLRQQNCCFPQ